MFYQIRYPIGIYLCIKDEYEQQEQDDTEEETTESADDIHSENEDQDSVNSQELPQVWTS